MRTARGPALLLLGTWPAIDVSPLRQQPELHALCCWRCAQDCRLWGSVFHVSRHLCRAVALGGACLCVAHVSRQSRPP